MKISTSSRIEPKLLDKLKSYASEKHWTTSQAIEEIVALFFNNYELTANDG